MQVTTTISLPKSLATEVDKQIVEGKFTSRSEFFRAAVRVYLLSLTGELSWDTLSTPFRIYAKQKGLKEADILKVVEEGRHGKGSKNN